MKFVVCTHSYLLLVTVTDDLTISDVKVLDKGYYDGCDVTKDGELIAAIRKTDPWSGKSPGEILWYNADGLTDIPRLDASDVLDPHQMTFDPQDRILWCTSSGNNSLIAKATHDIDETRQFRFYADHGEEGDFNHLNSVCVREDGGIYYVVAHNMGHQHSQIYMLQKIEKYLPVVGVINLPFCGIHNCEVADGYYHFNASDDGKVVRFQLDKSSEESDEAEIGEQYHPKGMTLTDEYCVVGYSEHAVETPRRYISRSGLAFVDRASWEVKSMQDILVEGRNVGNVNEVREFGPRRDFS